MIRHAPITVGRATGVHSRRVTAQVLEYRGFPVLVRHTIPLEDDTAFVFTLRVALCQFRVLFHADAKQEPEMHLLTIGPCPLGNGFPFFNRVLIPDVFIAQPFPFRANSLLCGFDHLDLSLTHRTGYTRIERKQRTCVLDTMSDGSRVAGQQSDVEQKIENTSGMLLW